MTTHWGQRPPGGAPNVLTRLRVAIALLAGIGFHDFRAPRTYIARMYPDIVLPVKLLRFAGWV